MTSKTILIVDDDPLQRSLTATFLGYQNYMVLEASTAKQALKLLKQHNFDLVLTDITLPGIDGLTLTRQIRQKHSEVKLPIIILSSFSESQKKKVAFEAGANVYLSKPINVQKLLKLIASLFE